MVNDSDHEASDGGTAPGPARSLRPRRPRLGANYDELATSPDMILILTPFQPRSCSVCAEAGRGRIYFLRLADELRHYQEAHQRSSLKFRCSNCYKEFSKRHAADCHRPKCPGVPPAEEGLQCGLCEHRFLTQRGLSQHLRHRHPAASNESRRLAAEVPKGPRKPPPHKAWTEEEERVLAELEVQFKDEKFIAKAIAGVLKTKNVKQIRDKRADVRRKMRRQGSHLAAQPASPVQADEGDNRESGELDSERADSSDCPPTPSAVEVPAEVVGDPPSAERNDEFHQWAEGVIVDALTDIDEEPPALGGFIHEVDVLLHAARSGAAAVTQDDIDVVYELLMSSLPASDERRGRTKRKGSGKRAYRRYLFAKTQDLYNKNPGLLAKYVRNGTDHWVQGEFPLQVEDIRQMYETLWNTKPVVHLPDLGDLEDALPLSDLLTPITISDVRGRITRTRTDTAPGLDGIRKSQLWSRGAVNSLRKLYCLLMVTGLQPSPWRKNRTILIPKEGTDAHKCQNYRPLTISSLLCRLYWGIIDTKLRVKVRGTPRQKGFTSERGCYNNVHILAEILAHSKEQGGLVAVQLDISKAFDTVPHDVLGPALRRKGVHEHVVQLVCRAYEDVHTNIQYGGTTIPVHLQRGVKQGDPLSPLLFNTIMEPLLLALEKQPGYRITEEQGISCMAFADDLILVARDVPQARNLLNITETYLTALGMSISAPKCTAFQVVPTKGSYFVKDPGLFFSGGERVPYASAETRIRYLGISFTPWTGIDLGDLRAEVGNAIKRVKRLALKPHQKINLLSTHLVPHYLYRLITGVAPVKMLRLLDGDLRGAVKDILHLPASVSNGLIYAGKRNGGLGFPKLEIICVSSSLKSGLSFLNNPDPAIQALARATGLEAKLRSQARAARLNWPVASVKQVDKWKADAKKRELQLWGECTAQGKAVHNYKNDRIGNAWLYNPTLLKPTRFLTALRLRTDTAGNRVAINRATPLPDTLCRKCRGMPETLAHILGQCTHTKAQRIRRHDDIVDLVMAEIPKRNKEAVVLKEPRIENNGVALKPDLVVKSQGRVFVVDVTVRHEDGSYLDNGRREKIEKYSPLLPTLKGKMGTSIGDVLPIVIGARGALPKTTIEALQRLNIKNRKTLLTMSLLTLRSSIEIYHSFLDYDVPRRVRRLREPP